MDWTAGYASDIEYTSGFYREQSPTWLNFVSLLNGIQPIDIAESFNYFELGFGRGLTAQILAAGHPQGQFYDGRVSTRVMSPAPERWPPKHS